MATRFLVTAPGHRQFVVESEEARPSRLFGSEDAPIHRVGEIWFVSFDCVELGTKVAVRLDAVTSIIVQPPDGRPV